MKEITDTLILFYYKNHISSVVKMNNPVIFLSTEGNCANNYYLWKPCQRQQESDPQESDEISLSCTLDGVRFFIFHTPL
jgi:hypothetical protein